MGLLDRVRPSRRRNEPGDETLWMIVGLGNPGPRYANTRHNTGARSVEALAERLGAKMKPAKARAVAGEARWNGRRLVLVRSTTYYNEVGQAVAPLARWYKVAPENLIVIHDDIDLPACTLRLKFGGGTAGNHGLDSLVGSLSTKDFYRVRIGAGRPSNPAQEPADFVLENMPKKVAEDFAEAEERAGDAALSLIADGLDRAMNEFNSR